MDTTITILVLLILSFIFVTLMSQLLNKNPL
jgi:hypothetical protein